MKRTKEKREQSCFIFKSLTKYVFCVLMTFAFTKSHIAHAAIIEIHNYVTNDSYNYSRAQVKYVVNGTPVSTELPGLILSNGAAVGPFNEVFGNTLGATTDFTEGKQDFTIWYDSHTIKMTLGNSEAIIDGTKTLLNNAPMLYSFNENPDKYLYVPTRCLAEAFGFEYTWTSSTSTASISRPKVIYDGNKKVNYTETSPIPYINGISVTSELYPGYIFDGTIFFSAEELFDANGIASVGIAEGNGLIVIKKGEKVVRMVIDSPIAYIDDKSYILSSVPRLISPANDSEPKVYVPAEFIANAFGYDTSYSEASGIFAITGDLQSNNNTFPDSADSSVVPDTSTFEESIFNYSISEELYAEYKKLGVQTPKEISAYSCLNSDAIYLKGVKADSVIITDKSDVLEIMINGYQNLFDKKLYYSQEDAFLNFCYISGSDSIRLLMIKSKELHYYSYEVDDGYIIHLTDSLGLYSDYISCSKPSEEITETHPESNITDVFSGEDLSVYYPEAVFSRNQFVIQLPENIKLSTIKDYDDYEKKRFTISIPGNHMNFFSEQDYYNPVETLTDVKFSYKQSENITIITFNTSRIQGYEITVSGSFLALKIADPKDIYDKIIVLDAGHGGIDPGTLRGSVYEKNINYNVTNVYAEELFKDSDIKVYYTRRTDTKIALQTRADFAAMVGADLFISFHVNANSSSAVNGTSVYYSASNNKATESGLKSSILARTVVNYLSESWGTKNRGILTEKFVVIHNNSVPAILVECGFITNDKDFAKIKDASYQKKAAEALYDAVSEIFENYPTKR